MVFKVCLQHTIPSWKLQELVLLLVDVHLCLYELGGQHEHVNLHWHLVCQSVFLYTHIHIFIPHTLSCNATRVQQARPCMPPSMSNTSPGMAPSMSNTSPGRATSMSNTSPGMAPSMSTIAQVWPNLCKIQAQVWAHLCQIQVLYI